jgi:hypothetical protein
VPCDGRGGCWLIGALYGCYWPTGGHPQADRRPPPSSSTAPRKPHARPLLFTRFNPPHPPRPTCAPQALSNLSPWLHFGQLGAQRAALEAAKHRAKHKARGAGGVFETGWAGGKRGCGAWGEAGGV